MGDQQPTTETIGSEAQAFVAPKIDIKTGAAVDKPEEIVIDPRAVELKKKQEELEKIESALLTLTDPRKFYNLDEVPDNIEIGWDQVEIISQRHQNPVVAEALIEVELAALSIMRMYRSGTPDLNISKLVEERDEFLKASGDASLVAGYFVRKTGGADEWRANSDFFAYDETGKTFDVAGSVALGMDPKVAENIAVYISNARKSSAPEVVEGGVIVNDQAESINSALETLRIETVDTGADGYVLSSDSTELKNAWGVVRTAAEGYRDELRRKVSKLSSTQGLQHLKIEIDMKKVTEQVKEIEDDNYFQSLQAAAKKMRKEGNVRRTV